MARHNDSAPIGYTCGTIDSVIGYMENAMSEAQGIERYPEEVGDNINGAVIIINELHAAINIMEDIRGDNVKLRDWGNEEHQRAEELQSEYDNLISQYERLQDEFYTLQAEVEELKETTL